MRKKFEPPKIARDRTCERFVARAMTPWFPLSYWTESRRTLLCRPNKALGLPIIVIKFSSVHSLKIRSSIISCSLQDNTSFW
uniref:Uncharacterized protein n=1 Tax=Arundo donax TaxID=35708 RepID=A0A0A9CLR5_ARUDO